MKSRTSTDATSGHQEPPLDKRDIFHHDTNSLYMSVEARDQLTPRSVGTSVRDLRHLSIIPQGRTYVPASDSATSGLKDQIKINADFCIAFVKAWKQIERCAPLTRHLAQKRDEAHSAVAARRYWTFRPCSRTSRGGQL
jgi:hypothetical protein